MIRRPPRSTQGVSSAASDVYKRQVSTQSTWDIIQMGCWEDITNVVKVKSPWHIVLLIVNIIFSGVGTMISACMDSKLNTRQLIVGLVQFLFCWTIIMWIASIYWGILICKKGGQH
eukprot:TRINITY_DN1530_c0_g1_i3.p2 TRINITY_DN1530_c0_g1~~TRINITY_DN1530_c0_g1_i3.p2  ORF type:complete len:116 (-),score=19.80 TRINITY_DN1530_c0_g1_i3:71-418(-)